VRQADGTIIQESTIAATRHALDEWMRQLPQPWMAGMGATLFTGWIYDYLESAAGSMPTTAAQLAAAQLALGTLPVWYILSTTWQPNWIPRLVET
jgi:transposase